MKEPRMSQMEYEKKIDKIQLCGLNRGPHKYIPVAWVKTEKEEHVQTLMCTVCFSRVSMKVLYEQFDEATM